MNTILFDFDGTVMDTNELIVQSFQHTYKTISGKEKKREDILNSFGEPLSITLKREVDIPVEEAIEIYRDFHYGQFEKFISLFDGIESVIKELFDRGYKLGIVTSRLKRTTMMGLTKYGIDQYFKTIVAADDCTLHKPHPEPILKALEKLGSQPEKALMIGDSPFDIKSARNANVKSAVVSWSVLSKELYMNEKPNYVINKVEDILILVDNINNTQ
ncbi:MAG: pyrophosphatase PpaX [Clostridia bacterium]|nr:pyrophosphatase PpaX [Clostridia bacterium]